ncbi:DUF1772 domain-containing protein [Streptomyces gilvosporeus]
MTLATTGQDVVDETGDAGAGLVVTATALLVLSVLMSIALLVPINSRVAQWTQGSVPADRKQQFGRWDRLHYVRVGVIITAFVPLVTGRA